MPESTGHCIEVEYKGSTYRYYGYAHVPNARCLGEGDWRAFADGKEYRTHGCMIPAAVLHKVSDFAGLNH